VIRRLLWAVPLLGLVELGAHVYFARRPPAFDDWLRLKEPVTAMKRDGELVVVAPPWADPLARRALGDGVLPLREVARPDETRYRTALEISILGEQARALEGWRELERTRVGDFSVRRLENPHPAEVAFDFSDHLGPDHASVRTTEPAGDCPWSARAPIVAGGLGGNPTFPPERFQCPGGAFFNVGVTVIADQDFAPRRCIWAHPPRRGEVRVVFRDVPLGRVIRGHHGMYWMIEREERGAPVELAIRVDGETVGEVVHRDGEGFSAFEVPLGAHAETIAREVELAVRSRDYKDRHYCFEADTR
jgi:hypothetical protein